MIEIRIKDETPELMQKLQAAISRFTSKGAQILHGKIVNKHSKAPRGGKFNLNKIKKIKKKGVVVGHKLGDRRSAPGEAPAVDSGDLKKSIDIISQNSLEAKIGTNMEYAEYLEVGTVKMAARPLWESTLKEELPSLEKLLASELRKI